MAGPKLAKRSADENQIAQIASQTTVRHGEQRVGPAVSPEAIAQNRAGQALAQAQRLLDGGQRVRNFLNETGMQTPNMQANRMLGEMSSLSKRASTVPAGASEAERQRLMAINTAAKNAGAALCGSPPDLQLAASLYRRALALEQLNGQVGVAGGSKSTQPAQALYVSAFQAVKEGDTVRASSLVGAADLHLRTRDGEERTRALALGRTIQSGDPSQRAMAERELQARTGAHNLEKSGSSQEETRKTLRLAAGLHQSGLHNEGILARKFADVFHNAGRLARERRDRVADSLRAIRDKVRDLQRCKDEGRTLMQVRGAEGQDSRAFWEREHLDASVHMAAVEMVAYEQRLSEAMNSLGLSMQTAIANLAMDLIKSLQGKLKDELKEEEIKLLKKAAEEIIDCLTEEGKLRKLGKKKAADLFHAAAEKFAKVKEAGKGKIAAAMAEAEKALIKALKMGKAEESVKEREAARKTYIRKLMKMQGALTALAKKLGGATDSKGKKIFDEEEFRKAIRSVRDAIGKAKTKAEMDKWMGSLSGLQKAIDFASRRAKKVLLLRDMAKEAEGMLRMAKNYKGTFDSLMKSYSGLMDKEMVLAFRRAFMGLATLVTGKKEDEHAATRLLGLQSLQNTLAGLLQKARDGTLGDQEMDTWASRFRGAKLNFKAQMNGIALQFSALKEALSSRFSGKQAEKHPMLRMGMEESAKSFLRAAELAHDNAILRGEKGREFSEEEIKRMKIVGEFGGLVLFVHDGKLFAARRSRSKEGKGRRKRAVTRYITEFTFHEDLSMFQKRKDKDLLEMAKEVITHREDLLGEARKAMKEGYLARGRYMPHRVFTLVAQEQADEWERSMHGRGNEKFAGQLDRMMSMLVRAEVVFSGERRTQFYNLVARSMDLILAGRKLMRDSRGVDDIDAGLAKLERAKKAKFDSGAKLQAKAEKTRGTKKAVLERKAEKLFREEAELAKKIGGLKEKRKELATDIQRGMSAWQENKIPEPSELNLVLDNLVKDGEQRIARDEQAEKVLQAMKGVALLATSFIHGGAGLAAWGADLAYNIYKTGDVHAKEMIPFALSVATHGASSYVAAMMKARGAVAGEAGATAMLRSPWQVSTVKALAATNSGVGLAIGMEGAVDALGQMRPGMDTADWVSALNAIIQGFGLPVAHSVQGQRRMARAALLENPETARRYVNALTMEQLYAGEGAKASWESAKKLGFEGSRAEFNDALRAHHNAKIVRKYSAYPEANFAEAKGYSGNAEQFKMDLQRRRALENAFRAEDPAANASANEAAARAALAQAAAQAPAAARAEAVTKVVPVSERITPPAIGEGATPPGPSARKAGAEEATRAERASKRATPLAGEKASPKAEDATAAARRALGEEKTKAERVSERVTPPAGPEKATPIVTPVGEEATARGGRVPPGEEAPRPGMAEDRTSPLRKLTPEEAYHREISRDLSSAKASLDIVKGREQAAFDKLAEMVHTEKEPGILNWRKRAWRQRRAKAVEAALKAAQAKLDAGVSPKDLSPAEAAASMLIDARNEAGAAQKAFDSHPGHQRVAERDNLNKASYEEATERVGQLELQAKIQEMSLVRQLELRGRSEAEQRSAIDAAVKSALSKRPDQLTSPDIRALELAGVRERLRVAKDVQATELGKRAESNRIAAPMDADALRSGDGAREMLKRRGVKFTREDLAADFSKAQRERGPLGTEEARGAVYRGMGIEVGRKALQDSSLFDMLMRGDIEGKLNAALGESGARITRIRQLAGLKGAYELTMQTAAGEVRFYAKTNSFVADGFGARVAQAVGLKTPPVYAIDPQSGKPFAFTGRNGKEVQYGFMRDIRRFASEAGKAAPTAMESTFMMRDIVEGSTPEAKAVADALADPKIRQEFYRALGDYMERTRWAGLGDRFPRNTAVTFKNGKFEFHPIDLDSGGIVMALRDAKGKFNDRNMRSDYGEAISGFADYIAKAQPHLEQTSILREMRRGFLQGTRKANRELAGRRKDIVAEMHRLMDGHHGKPHGVSFSEESGIRHGDRPRRNFNGEQPPVGPTGRVIYDSPKAKDAFDFNIGQRQGRLWKDALDRGSRYSQRERIASLKEKGLQVLQEAELSTRESLKRSLTPEALLELEKAGGRSTKDAAAAYRLHLEAVERLGSEMAPGAPKDLQQRLRFAESRENALFSSLLDAIQRDGSLTAKGGTARALRESALRVGKAREDLAIAVRGEVKEPIWRVFARELIRPPEAGMMRAEAGPEAIIVRRLLDAAKAVREELIMRRKAAPMANEPDVAWMSNRIHAWARKSGISLPRDAGESLARMALEAGMGKNRIIEIMNESRSSGELFNSLKKDMLWELAKSAPEKAFAEQESALRQTAEATRSAKDAADRAAGRALKDAEVKSIADAARAKPVSSRTELEARVLELESRSRELASAQRDLDTLRLHGLAQREARVPTPAENVAISNETAVALALSKDRRYAEAMKKGDARGSQAIAEQYAHLRNVVENTKTTVAEGRFVDVVRDARQVIAFGDRHADLNGTLDQMLRTGILIDTGIKDPGRKSLPAGQRYRLNPDLPKGTQLVFVGDYIDRGPGSMGVVDLVRAMKEQAGNRGISVHALRGNHEALFLKFIERHGNKTTDQVRALFSDNASILKAMTEDKVNWARIGMKETFDSILAYYGTGDWQVAMSRMKQDGTLNFLNSLKGAVIIDGSLFTHGGPVLKAKSAGELDAHFARLFGNPDNHWSVTELQFDKALEMHQMAIAEGDFSSIYIGQGWYKHADLEGWMNGMGLRHIYVGHDPAMKSVHMYNRLATGIDAGLFHGYGGNSQVPIIDPLRAEMPIRVVKGRDNQPTTTENFANGRGRTDISAGSLSEIAQKLYDRGEAIVQPEAKPAPPKPKTVTPETGAAVKGEIVRPAVSDREFVQLATELEKAKAAYREKGGDPENAPALLKDTYDGIESNNRTEKMEAAIQLERASRYFEEARASREGLRRPAEPAPKETLAPLEDALLGAEQKARALDAQFDKLSPAMRHAALRDVKAMQAGRFRGQMNQYHRLVIDRQKAVAELETLREKAVAERQRVKAPQALKSPEAAEVSRLKADNAAEAKRLSGIYERHKAGEKPADLVDLAALKYMEEKVRAGTKPEEAALSAAELSSLSRESNPAQLDPASVSPELAEGLANYKRRMQGLMWEFPEAFRPAETIILGDGTMIRIGSPLRLQQDTAVPVYITQNGKTNLVMAYGSESHGLYRRFAGYYFNAYFKGAPPHFKGAPVKYQEGVLYLGEHFQAQDYRIQKAIDRAIGERAQVDAQRGGERLALLDFGFNGHPRKGWDADTPAGHISANEQVIWRGEESLQVSMNASAEKIDISAPGNKPARIVDHWFAGSDSSPYGRHIKAVISSENGKYLYGVMITEDGMFLSYMQEAVTGINGGGSPKKGIVPSESWVMKPIIEYDSQITEIRQAVPDARILATIVGERGGRVRISGVHETPKSPLFELNNGLAPLYRMLRAGEFGNAKNAMLDRASGKAPLTSAEKPKSVPIESLKTAIEERTNALAKAFDAYKSGRLDPSTPEGRAMMGEMGINDRDIDIFRRWKEAPEGSRMVRLGRRAAQWAMDEAAAGRLKPEPIKEPAAPAVYPEDAVVAKAAQDIDGIRKRALEKGLDPQDVLARMVRLAESEKAAGRAFDMAKVEEMAVAEAAAAKGAGKPVGTTPEVQIAADAANLLANYRAVSAAPGKGTIRHPAFPRMLEIVKENPQMPLENAARMAVEDTARAGKLAGLYEHEMNLKPGQTFFFTKEVLEMRKIAADHPDWKPSEIAMEYVRQQRRQGGGPMISVGAATEYGIRYETAKDAGINWTKEMEANLLARAKEMGIHESLTFDAYLNYRKGREATFEEFMDAAKFAGDEKALGPRKQGEVNAAREAMNEAKRQWELEEGPAGQGTGQGAVPETAKKKFYGRVREWIERRRELRKAEAEDFLRQYGIPINEAGLIGGAPPSPQLLAFKGRQMAAKNAGFKWTNENNNDLSHYAKLRTLDENVLFDAYRRFRKSMGNEYWGTPENRVFNDFARSLDPAYKPSAVERRVKLQEKARDALDNALKSAAAKVEAEIQNAKPEITGVMGEIAKRQGAKSIEEIFEVFGPEFIRKRLSKLGYSPEKIREAFEAHSDIIMEHFENEVRGKSDKNLKEIISTYGPEAGRTALEAEGYPPKAAKAIIDGYGDEIAIFKQRKATIPALPHNDLPRAAVPLISSDEAARVLEGFGLVDIGKSKEHDFKRPKRDETGAIIPGEYTGKIVIPRNRKQVALGTLESVIREMGVTRREFLQKALDVGVLTIQQGRVWGLRKSPSP